MAVDASELGYIAWETLSAEDCLYLIERATKRLLQLSADKEQDE